MGLRHRGKILAGFLLFILLGVTRTAAPQTSRRLVDALKGEDRPAAAALIRQNVDVNLAEPDGTTPLHWAVHWGDQDIVDQLIRAGAHVEAVNRYGVSALSVAAADGNSAMIEKLLKAGADPNAKLKEGESALMSVARTGNAEALRALLVHGAKVNETEGWRGQTALMWATIEDHPDTMKALIEAGADVHARSKSGFSALLFAVRAGYIDEAGLLLGSGADVNEKLPDGTSALVLAALNAHWELGALLLDRGADPNADGQGWTALHQLAITRSPHHDNVNPQRIPTGNLDSLDFVKALIAHGANVNVRAKKSPTDRFRQWIRREGSTPFFLAAKAADVPMMQLLVANGADPLMPTNAHVTPLAAAAGVGYCQGESPGTEAEALTAVKYTLQLGGDVNAVDDDGFTPMHGAATRGANSIIQFLYDHGAKLDLKSKADGWTPWTMANGVMLADTYKRQLQSAQYLRKLMDESGKGRQQ